MHWTGGDRIKEARKIRSFTIDDLAQKLKIARRTLINYESNKQEPQISTLIEVAKICQVSFSWLALGISNINEPKVPYGVLSSEAKILKELFKIEEVRKLIYKYMSEIIKQEELASELDKILIETFSQQKKEEQ